MVIISVSLLGITMPSCQKASESDGGKKFQAAPVVPTSADATTDAAATTTTAASTTGTVATTTGTISTDTGTISTTTGTEAVVAVTKKLTILGKRREDSGLKIEIGRADGSWLPVDAPDKDQTKVQESVCDDDGDTTLSLRFTLEGNLYTPSQSSCFVGVASANGVVMGFDDECDETGWADIDDDIFEFQCDGGKIKIKDLRLDSGLEKAENLAQWLAGDS
jgi:hypothetical protein